MGILADYLSEVSAGGLLYGSGTVGPATVDQISAAYRQLLKREPSQQYLDAWQATGFNINEIFARIKNSPEYQSGAPASVTPAVETGGASNIPDDDSSLTGSAGADVLGGEEIGVDTGFSVPGSAEAWDVGQTVLGNVTTAGTLLGYSNPATGLLSFAAGQVARTKANEEALARGQPPIGFIEDITRPDMIYGTPRDILSKRHQDRRAKLKANIQKAIDDRAVARKEAEEAAHRATVAAASRYKTKVRGGGSAPDGGSTMGDDASISGGAGPSMGGFGSDVGFA